MRSKRKKTDVAFLSGSSRLSPGIRSLSPLPSLFFSSSHQRHRALRASSIAQSRTGVSVPSSEEERRGFKETTRPPSPIDSLLLILSSLSLYLVVVELALDESQHERALPGAHVAQEHELGLLELGREERGGHGFFS